ASVGYGDRPADIDAVELDMEVAAAIDRRHARGHGVDAGFFDLDVVGQPLAGRHEAEIAAAAGILGESQVDVVAPAAAAAVARRGVMVAHARPAGLVVLDLDPARHRDDGYRVFGDHRLPETVDSAAVISHG